MGELENCHIFDFDMKKIEKKNLIFCYDCAIKEACHNTNVAGYLTIREYANYKKMQQGVLNSCEMDILC